MASNYVIRASPGKGQGVFATKHIEPGTIILRELQSMKIERPSFDINETHVQEAFDALSKAEQEQFMSLHEAKPQYESQLLNIYKTNCFRHESHSAMYFNITRINHSCNPNAELARMEGDDESQIVAVRAIEKDEEILISYLGPFDQDSKSERALVLKSTWGFDCDCSTCNLTGSELRLSDCRRRFLNVLTHKLDGYEPAPLEWRTGEVAAKHGLGGKMIWRPTRELQSPLTTLEETRYILVRAMLLEAEGLVSGDLATTYMTAAAVLLKQLEELDSAVVVESASFVYELMAKSRSVMDKVRDAELWDVEALEMELESMEKSDHLQLAKSVMEGSVKVIQDKEPTGQSHTVPPLAVQLQKPYRALSQDECKALMRTALIARGIQDIEIQDVD